MTIPRARRTRLGSWLPLQDLCASDPFPISSVLVLPGAAVRAGAA